jgi:hypothetical protein
VVLVVSFHASGKLLHLSVILLTANLQHVYPTYNYKECLTGFSLLGAKGQAKRNRKFLEHKGLIQAHSTNVINIKTNL